MKTSLPKPSFSNTGSQVVTKALDQFQVDLFSGSPNYAIPLLLTPGRGLEPSLALSYHASTQNSIVGLGFDLSIPSMMRSTQWGFPSYNNDQDIFTSSWGELVLRAELTASGVLENGIHWTVRHYQTRLESAFNLIEFWEDEADKSNSYWVVKTGDGINHIFGTSSAGRVFDPKDSTRIFIWGLEKTIDAKGNSILYTYEKTPSESNHYLSQIQYGNFLQETTVRYAFTVILDYGAIALSAMDAPPISAQAVSPRSDPFISYHSGFLIQTTRLCNTILLIHQFPHLFEDTPFLVKAWELNYQLAEATQATQLKTVTQWGYKKLSTGVYLKKSLTPIQLGYSTWELPSTFQGKQISLPSDTAIPGELLPFRFVDLYREGLPGILYSDDMTTLFWRNNGDGSFQSAIHLASFPIDRTLNSRRCQLMTFPENEQMAFVVGERTYGGFYGSLDENGWADYQPFDSYTIDFIHPNAEFVDLNARGYSDLVIFNRANPYYYPSKGHLGFDLPQALTLPDDFPTHQFTTEQEVITLANIIGDGLQHRVRVTQNSVEYWPNVGHGCFGDKVTIPSPDLGDNFDAKCVFLVNTNGSGATDLIYVTSTQINIYCNLQGRMFTTTPISITLPDLYTHFDQIRLVDLFGKGIPSLIFTKIDVGCQHYYYDFAPAQRPYLLNQIDNALGLSISIRYTSSVQCYTSDLRAEPIRTPRYKCIFPVPVVDTVTRRDNITPFTLTERYQFHDGYYDPLERSFVGFGFVEYWDVDMSLAGPMHFLDSPPCYTKIWYHCGALPSDVDSTRLSDSNTADFNSSDPNAWRLSDNVFDVNTPALNAEGCRQALYALRGKVLRTEVYGLDGSAQQSNPYLVTSNNFTLRCLITPTTTNKGIFSALSRELLSYHYERNLNDPKISHSLYLQWDLFNHLLQSCQINYPRRGIVAPPERIADQTRSYQEACMDVYPQQQNMRILAQWNVINAQLFSSDHVFQFLGSPKESKIFAIPANTLTGCLAVFSDVQAAYTQVDQTDAALLHRQVYYYWDATQTDAITLTHAMTTLPLPLLHHIETLVETQETLTTIYQAQLASTDLNNIFVHQSGYLLENNSWWKPGQVRYYAPSTSYYLPLQTKSLITDQSNPVYTQSEVTYDVYHLIPITQRAYLYDTTKKILTGITFISVQDIDYHVCAPRQVMDANQTITEVLYDPLGVMIAASKHGSVNGIPMGNLPLDEAFLMTSNTLTPAMLVNEPMTYLVSAGTVSVYQLYDHTNPTLPASQCHVALEQFQQALPDLAQNPISSTAQKIQMVVAYSDGFGDVIEAKTNADTADRWLVSGYKVYNNKGKVVEAYLPYYTQGMAYESQAQIVSTNLPPPTTMRYDALSRLLRMDTPKGFYTKAEWSAWYVQQFDENDTYQDSPYYMSPLRTADEKTQLDSVIAFNQDTPTITLLDTASQGFCQIYISKTATASARLLSTTTVFDVLNRPVSYQDARLNQPNILFTYDKLGQILIEASVDSGQKIQLYNIYGNVIIQWNNRNYQFNFSYDNWQRPLSKQVQGGNGVSAINCHYEQLQYGDLEDSLIAQQNNLYGQLIEYRDQAGISLFSSFDIQGHSLNLQRTLYLAQGLLNIDWSNPSLALTGIPTEVLTQNVRIDALGKTQQHQQPDGSTYFFDHNCLEQIDAISLLSVDSPTPMPIIQQVSYLATGQKSSVRYGNGMETDYVYEDTTQFLLSLVTEHPSKVVTQRLQNITYDHDPKGNILDLNDQSYQQLFSLSPASSVVPASTYRYDSLYRLQSASSRAPKSAFFKPVSSGLPDSALTQALAKETANDVLESFSEAFDYDDGNNLTIHAKTQGNTDDLVSESKTFTMLPSSNRLQSEMGSTLESPITLHYDEQGNLLNIDNNTALTWNYLNQLVQFTKTTSAGKVEEFYYYASSGRRTRKLTLEYTGATVTAITETLYLKGYELKRNCNSVNFTVIASTVSKALRLYDNANRCIATYRSGNTAFTLGLTYHLGNHLRSVAIEVDNQANLITYEEYSSFGETTFMVSRDAEGNLTKTYRYSKEEYDPTTGFYYYGARYYSPQLGRWISTDPGGLIDGLNVYGFVRNNPINFIDLIGMFPIRSYYIDDAGNRREIGAIGSVIYNGDSKEEITSASFKGNPDGVILGWETVLENNLKVQKLYAFRLKEDGKQLDKIQVSENKALDFFNNNQNNFEQLNCQKAKEYFSRKLGLSPYDTKNIPGELRDIIIKRGILTGGAATALHSERPDLKLSDEEKKGNFRFQNLIKDLDIDVAEPKQEAFKDAIGTWYGDKFGGVVENNKKNQKKKEPSKEELFKQERLKTLKGDLDNNRIYVGFHKEKYLQYIAFDMHDPRNEFKEDEDVFVPKDVPSKSFRMYNLPFLHLKKEIREEHAPKDKTDLAALEFLAKKENPHFASQRKN